LLTGTLVNATATVNIDGASTGVTAGILHSKLIISSNLRNTLINADFPNGTYSLSLRIGEILTVFLGLEVFADSGKSYPFAHADYGHSAKFFLDFADERVTFDSVGQHDYRTNVALPSETPLPAALPLFATGLGAMGLLGWRRKRKNAAARAA
jgi:hypothetical protein